MHAGPVDQAANPSRLRGGGRGRPHARLPLWFQMGTDCRYGETKGRRRGPVGCRHGDEAGWRAATGVTWATATAGEHNEQPSCVVCIDSKAEGTHRFAKGREGTSAKSCKVS